MEQLWTEVILSKEALTHSRQRRCYFSRQWMWFISPSCDCGAAPLDGLLSLIWWLWLSQVDETLRAEETHLTEERLKKEELLNGEKYYTK